MADGGGADAHSNITEWKFDDDSSCFINAGSVENIPVHCIKVWRDGSLVIVGFYGAREDDLLTCNVTGIGNIYEVNVTVYVTEKRAAIVTHGDTVVLRVVRKYGLLNTLQEIIDHIQRLQREIRDEQRSGQFSETNPQGLWPGTSMRL